MDGNSWVFLWSWSRTFTGRLNRELQNLEDRIKTVGSLSEGESKWIFKKSGKEIYSSKIVASSIDDLLLEGNQPEPETLRNNLLPQKLRIFVWRALKNRLPAKVELDKRGIHLESLLCPLCNSEYETVEHAIFSCHHAKMVWEGILKWWGFNLGLNIGMNNAFRGLSVGAFSGFPKDLWQAIEWVTGYSIWKNINLKVFSNDNWAIPKIINEVQVKSFEWIKNRAKFHHMD
ncbi:uncharacterized protein [Rutidosis leptorrhynchoides]|uniref:uncharacterized protein n=1 Tax=Rutidosis leptorrhynchoides TaxID=125765 RepID=UPI003A995BF2